VDYLETRDDIDITRLAYFGVSLGAHTGVKHLALEPRFKAGVLASGGLLLAPEFKLAPEADHINFAPRVQVPTLMMNGRYDQWFPLQTSQVPLFKLLGTPLEHKRHAVFNVAHYIPQKERIKETLDWLDRHLGRVE
jgi:dienelactone hydrolase